MTRSNAILVVAASMVLAGCVSGSRAQLPQLQQRAVFDLGCAAQHLQLYHVDARTKVVTGCGRRLTYVEDCVVLGGTFECSWTLDTPTFAQQRGPTTPATRVCVQPPAAARKPPPKPTDEADLPPDILERRQ